ncbi:chorismate-binding protein, partial [Xanthomonas vesicatoria]
MTLTRSLHADIDLLALHRLAPQRYPALLESTASGTEHGRWDVLLLADGGSLRLDRDGRTRDGDGRVLDCTFLDALDAAWHAERVPRDATGALPFRGGWAVLLDYELASQVEPILQLPARTDRLPSALALRAPAAVLRDRVEGRCIALAEPGREDLLQRIVQDIAACAALPPLPAWVGPVAVDEDAPQRFTDAVQRVLDYLRAGDVFQANISRAWNARFAAAVDPAALHARLRSANPAPFAGVFVAAGRAVVSSSPERLVSVHGDAVQTRPIAGTRARFAGDDDAAR